MKLNQNLFKSSFIYVISNFSIAIIPFTMLPILSRYLTPEEYGVIAMFITIVAFFGAFTGLSSNGAIMVRFFDKGPFQINQYISSSIFILVLSTSIILLIVFLFGSLFEEYTGLTKTWLFIACLVSFSQFIVQIMLTIFQATDNPIKYAFLRFVQAIIEASLSLTLVVLFLMSWEGRLIGISAVWFLVSSFVIIYMLRKKWLIPSVGKADMRDMLRYGLPLMPHTIGALFLGTMDRFLVINILDIASAGIYMAAAQIGLILNMAVDAFNRAFAPWLMNYLSNRNHQDDIKLVKYTYIYFIIVLSIAYILGALSEYLVYFLLGEEFYGAIPLLKFIFYGNAFIGMYQMVNKYIFFTRKTELISMVTIFVGLITLLLSWYLITQEGLIGAAKAWMFGQMIMFFFTWILSNKVNKMPWFLQDALK
ncbi:MAG: hypothetical protein CBE49_000360 [Rickettsiales bacterium TMED289]|nr:MAG: hypothetical protein CBE49_000360 [Rickettsiales bacterium TMED289]